MEKVVWKYSSFQAADAADDKRYRELSGTEKLQELLELILPEDPDEAIIQRSARVYPLARGGKR
ncbi:MAG: hypothetical protein FJ398_27300 [Verrucomicrobia bacterium]|nr:hypothetical protein [Verrucomicrobiota bacterium]